MQLWVVLFTVKLYECTGIFNLFIVYITLRNHYKRNVVDGDHNKPGKLLIWENVLRKL